MGSQPARRRAKDLLEDVVAEALESLGFNVRVDHRVQGRAGEVEVDVWGEKLVEGTRFTVYASCKNWDGPVDVSTVREELGRVLQMTVIPHVRILVAPSFT
ncbi:MAG: restriction endonuclease, partial [Thermosphaera sp.]|nr:restriction endonuclease [Thermosphaera sp.]